MDSGRFSNSEHKSYSGSLRWQLLFTTKCLHRAQIYKLLPILSPILGGLLPNPYGSGGNIFISKESKYFFFFEILFICQRDRERDSAQAMGQEEGEGEEMLCRAGNPT